MYSQAGNQMGKTAYVQSGLQAHQDRLLGDAAQVAKDTGLPETSAVILIGTARAVRDKRLGFQGPEIFCFKTHFNVDRSSGSLGLGVRF